MRGYERDDFEDYDEYEEEGYEQQEEGEEEEYEEEEEQKPSAEAIEYLELRQRIKEQIRKKMQRENGPAVSKSQEIKKKLPSDNYGSFFGPSQPVIAQRVIQESKLLLENPHLAFRVSNSHHQDKKTSSSSGTGSKNGVRQPLPKVRNELKTKVQKLRDTRDYSFLLSDDAELPASPKPSVPQTVATPKSEARSAQVPQKSKQLSGSNVRDIRGAYEERKSIPINGRMHSKSGLYKSTSTDKPTSASTDLRRQLGSNNGSGPGRPTGPKGLPSKMPLSTMEKKSIAPAAKTILPAARKPLPPNKQSSVPRLQVEQKRVLPQPKKNVVMPNKPVASSKPQINRPVKQISSHASLQNNHPKKKPARPFFDDEDEDTKALDIIRQMFNTRRYADRYDDEDDDSMMEANFDDIMREERRSAKIAKEEDEEQLRLIEEEERREQQRKLAKKRKLSQH
ncbi:uncharacterized protein LOC110646188 isoform X2 [Hevea brasiliensis]|uniref:uncharacterized protein LOC110646188 isoform X2 n=1 Tax=Hevea brasiliensis TaxID=3981 RepID=UPI0025E2F32D|nr:uncharacterized protein LOC110646188 isoform X2 [Hevea brasiliensis]